LSIIAVILPFYACTEKTRSLPDKFPYEKISPSSWKALKSVRDSHKPMPNLDSLYANRVHPNGLPYHLYVPDKLSPGAAYPLVVFLHGHTDLDLNTHGGFPKGIWSLPSVQSAHPHVLFVPRHRTADDNWTDPDYRGIVIETMDDLVTEFNNNPASPGIDTSRIYITGFSQGAMGVWDYVRRYPCTFAAAVPLSGYFHGPRSQGEAAAVKHVPIWIFNGADDDGVDGSRESYAWLKLAGAANVRYHEFVEHGHVIDDFAYFTDGFMDWLFAQELESQPR
jgi:predicted peptidase